MYRSTRRSPKRPAFVLIIVLLIVALMSLAAYKYSDSIMGEYRAASASQRATQARGYADSGVHYAAAILCDSEAVQTRLNGNAFDNPGAFQVSLPGGEGSPNGQFSIIAIDYNNGPNNEPTLRYGALDEAGKINVNALVQLNPDTAYNALMKLPNMTSEIANAIIDYIDADDEPRAGGAESSVYASRGYRCKNGPLDSVEELLLVQGVTQELLFGSDMRRRDGTNNFPGQQYNVGWAAYLTVYSRESNVDSGNNPRLYINSNNNVKPLTQLYDELKSALGDEEMAAFIMAVRLYTLSNTGTGSTGMTGGTTGGSTGMTGGTTAKGGNTVTLPTSASQRAAVTAIIPKIATDIAAQNPRARNRISSIFSLINAEVTVSIPGMGKGAPATNLVITSPLKDESRAAELLPKLLDLLTTSQNSDLPARVNVNTAPREVLATLPGITDSELDTIIKARPSPDVIASDANFSTPAWLFTQANLTPARLVALEQYVTARTQTYRIQSVGGFENGRGPWARVEAIIDANAGKPRIVYYRDLSELGPVFPFQLNQQQP